MPRWVISSPSHMSSVRPPSADHDQQHLGPAQLPTEVAALLLGEGVEEEDVAKDLQRPDRRSGTRVLRDLLLADFAFLLELLERRYDHGHHCRMIEAVM